MYDRKSPRPRCARWVLPGGGLLAALVAATALILTGASPAFAATASATVVGHGMISPGLTTTPTDQTFAFGGTAVVAGTGGVSGVYTCSVDGSSSVPETVASGAGIGSGSCTKSGVAIDVSVTYLREAGSVTLSGSASGAVTGSLTGECSFEPTTAPTVTAFELQCAVAIS